MKNKPDLAVTADAVRVAAEKAAKTRRVADAEERLAHAAKVRFKSAKKTWKLARKVAKRSAKRATLAENDLAALQKQLKRAGKKAKAKSTTRQKPVARNRATKHSRKRNSVTSASASIPAVGSVPPASGETGAV